jgi:DNA-binding NtrC family response regulator
MLVGTGSAIRGVREQIPKLTGSESTVLIQGESGTGKELVARAAHACSARPGSFVPVNCGAIPIELFERKLFCHKRSAFGGAVTSESGLIHAAEEGTLFLGIAVR